MTQRCFVHTLKSAHTACIRFVHGYWYSQQVRRRVYMSKIGVRFHILNVSNIVIDISMSIITTIYKQTKKDRGRSSHRYPSSFDP